MKCLYITQESSRDLVTNVFSECFPDVYLDVCQLEQSEPVNVQEYDYLMIQVTPNTLDWLERTSNDHHYLPSCLLLYSKIEPYMIKKSVQFIGVQSSLYMQHTLSVFLRALRDFLSGRLYLDPHLTQLMMQDILSGDVEGIAHTYNTFLNKEERTLIEGLIEGKTNQELADDHFIDRSAVSKKMKQLRKKCEVNNNTELVAKSLVNGWISSKPYEVMKS